jgi:hypothetical protein
MPSLAPPPSAPRASSTSRTGRGTSRSSSPPAPPPSPPPPSPPPAAARERTATLARLADAAEARSLRLRADLHGLLSSQLFAGGACRHEAVEAELRRILVRHGQTCGEMAKAREADEAGCADEEMGGT